MANAQKTTLTPKAFTNIDKQQYPLPEEIRRRDIWAETQLNRGAAPNWRKENWKPWPFAEAYRKCNGLRYIGIVLSADHPYCVIDIDIKGSEQGHKNARSELTPEAEDLIQELNTYTEYSKGGRGIHIVFKLKDKSVIPFGKKNIKQDFDGEIYIKKGFVIFTNNSVFPDEDRQIKTLSYQDIAKFFPSLFLVDHCRDAPTPSTVPIPAPTTSPNPVPNGRKLSREMESALARSAFKCNKATLQMYLKALTPWATPQIKQVYERVEKQGYSNYDFWLKIICAVKDFCDVFQIPENEVLEELDLWSQQDVLKGYDIPDSTGKSGFELLRFKWNSFVLPGDKAPSKSFISWKTLRFYANQGQIPWPLLNSKGWPLKRLKNFDALMTFYNLQFQENFYLAKQFRIKGDADILEEIWGIKPGAELDAELDVELIDLESLGYGIQRLCQSKFLVPSSTTAQEAKNYITAFLVRKKREKYNPIHEWVASRPFDGNSLEKAFFDIIDYQEEYKKYAEVYKTAIKKTCMQLIKAFLYKGEYPQNTLLTVFCGPENCHKTTFIQKLLPQFLREKYFETIPEGLFRTKSGNRVEAEMKMRGAAILEISEFDGQLSPGEEATMKSLISNHTVFHRVPYGLAPLAYPLACIMFGSSNARVFKLGHQGNRRIPIIPVTYIHTERIAGMDIQQLWAQWYEEMETALAKDQNDTSCWTLTPEEIPILENAKEDLIVGKPLDPYIDQLYEWETPFTDYTTKNGHKLLKTEDSADVGRPGLCRRMKDVAADLQNIVPSRESFLGLSEIKEAISRKCAKWTGTLQKSKPWDYPKGDLIYGCLCSKDGRKLYLVPPLREPISKPFNDKGEIKEQFENNT